MGGPSSTVSVLVLVASKSIAEGLASGFHFRKMQMHPRRFLEALAPSCASSSILGSKLSRSHRAVCAPPCPSATSIIVMISTSTQVC